MEYQETVSLEKRNKNAEEAADAALYVEYLEQLLFTTATKSTVITATPTWLSIFNPIAVVDVTNWQPKPNHRMC